MTNKTSLIKITTARAWTRNVLAHLNIVGWDVDVRWGTPKDIEDGLFFPDCDGCTHWQVEHHKAVILLSTVLRADPDNLLSTICHECLHLRLESHLERPRKYDVQYEHALNVLSDALKKGLA